VAILDEFDPKRDGWFFNNWGEDVNMPFSWDLYRKTYLAINPTNDPVEAPLDVAFYEIFKSCAQGGNCGGMTMLALAIYKYGGYFGFCSPAAFYTGISEPDRADVHQAINIMQARQFSTPGIRNFVDVVKAGQLNDGVAAFNRIHSGLASGDYCLLSVADSPVGGNAHTIIPYRADDLGTGTRVLHVWDPNLPYDDFPSFYDNDLNKIVITGSTAWSYDQNAGGAFTGGRLYAGSQMGGFFAIAPSLLIHKGHQPISPGFALTQLSLLFIQGLGSAVTQLQDADGRRLYRTDRASPTRGDLETDPDRQLTGVAPWPWFAAHAPDGSRPGDLFFLERPPGSSSLTVTVRGSDYRLVHASTGHLSELNATSNSAGRDRVLIEGSGANDQVLEMRSDATGRRADIHHLRLEAGGDWRSVAVSNARVTRDGLRVHAGAELDGVDVSSAARAHEVDLEFRQYRDKNLTRRRFAGQRIPSGRAFRLAPADWDRLTRTKIDQILV
jgi:hypothetical protein